MNTKHRPPIGEVDGVYFYLLHFGTVFTGQQGTSRTFFGNRCDSETIFYTKERCA